MFIERGGYIAQDWGAYWDWTAIRNADGTWSVGARFLGAPPGGVNRNVYVTCVIAEEGDKLRLITLSRLQ